MVSLAITIIIRSSNNMIVEASQTITQSDLSVDGKGLELARATYKLKTIIMRWRMGRVVAPVDGAPRAVALALCLSVSMTVTIAL